MAERGRKDSRRPGAKSRGRTTTSTKKPVAAPAKPRSAASKSPQPKADSAAGGPRVTARAVILLAILAVLLASYATSLNTWWNQRQEIAMLEIKKSTLEAEIADLEDIQQRWEDPAFIRNQARERFGWVMPGEVGYRVIGLDGQLKGEGPTLDAPKALPEENWLDRLWRSFQAVDHPPEAETTNEIDPDTVLKKKDS